MLINLAFVCVLFVLTTGQQWTMVPPSSSAPSPRYDFAYGYSSASNKLYVFGGATNDSIIGDFYSFDIASHSWTALPTGPAARQDAGGVFCNGKFYLVGGNNGTFTYDDMWTFDEGPQKWTLVGNYTDMLLSAGSLVCAAKLLYFGGTTLTPSGNFSSATFVYDQSANNWTLTTLSGPSAREWTPMAYAPAPFGQTVLFGGWNGSDPQCDDLWLLSDAAGSQWEQVPVQSVWPAGRSGQAMAYDPSTESIFMFGGEDNDGVTGLNDLWYFSLRNKTWSSKQLSNVPRGRLGAGAVVTSNNSVIVFGGITGWTENDTFVNDLWILSSADSSSTTTTTTTTTTTSTTTTTLSPTTNSPTTSSPTGNGNNNNGNNLRGNFVLISTLFVLFGAALF